jgi:hypothetical protein
MKVLLGLVFLFVGTQWSQAQLEISSESTKKDRSKQASNDSSATAIFLAANWSQTNRVLSPNGGLFGEELGKRSEEDVLNTWSYFLGVRGGMKHGFFWEGGMAFLQNGESYKFKDQVSDSTFSYNTTYSYIGMPVKINYGYGKNFRIYGGVGLLPQLFFGYKQDQQWSTPENGSSSNEIALKSGYNTFVISTIASAGIEISVHRNWRLFLAPEIRWQLNSSYVSQDAYIHKSRAYGVTFGLIRNL